MIEVIESKLSSVCLINDYSLITDPHIFVYGRAEFSSISLECTKLELSILNNFEQNYRCYQDFLRSLTIMIVVKRYLFVILFPERIIQKRMEFK